MDNKLSIGDKIELEKIETRLSVDPDKKPEKYNSQVLDEAPNDRIYAAMPIRGGTVVPLGVGQTFYATFFSNSGLLRCEVVVTGRYKKGGFFLVELEQKSSLQKVQRREFFRYECRKQIQYRIIEGEEKEMIRAGNAFQADEHSLEWKDAIMIDLSGGGIRMVSSASEEKGAFVELRFDIEINEEVEILYVYAELLRSERNQNNTSIYDHRIMFWKLDSGTREKIIRYIFEQQRKKRAQQLG
ncbi:MAG: flagellar brake protein [Lachnospiraceae bacterium]|nr:flagellar brake protein [Lachnospiraceae bacterium]